MSKNKYPENYTVSEMVACLSDRCDITKKQSKEVFDSLMDIVREGVIKNERVPLGDLGKVFAYVKPATKERAGRNPATGATITIPAKSAYCTPKMSFSKNFKEEVSKKVKA